MHDFSNLEFGDSRPFKLLAINNNMEQIYADILHELLISDFWSSENLKAPRVLWKDAFLCRKLKLKVFSKSGLYIWGAGSVPRYIGKTNGSFEKRFRRYIWDQKSQCRLAEKYETDIIRNGIQGFPDEIHEWYKKGFGRSTVRLQGAVDFARHGLDTIWFSLFPLDEKNPELVNIIEETIISVANNWNLENGLAPLLNINFA
jgi:hypothetical protein